MQKWLGYFSLSLNFSISSPLCGVFIASVFFSIFFGVFRQYQSKCITFKATLYSNQLQLVDYSSDQTIISDQGKFSLNSNGHGFVVVKSPIAF